MGWLGSRVVSVLDSGAVGPGFKSQLQHCQVTCLRQTVHIHRASVHQAVKLVAALLRVAGVTAGLAESNGSLPPGLWLTSPVGWLAKTGISSGTLHSVIEYGLPIPFLWQKHHENHAAKYGCLRDWPANEMASSRLHSPGGAQFCQIASRLGYVTPCTEHSELITRVIYLNIIGKAERESEIRNRWYTTGTTSKQVVMVWARAAKRRW